MPPQTEASPGHAGATHCLYCTPGWRPRRRQRQRSSSNCAGLCTSVWCAWCRGGSCRFRSDGLCCPTARHGDGKLRWPWPLRCWGPVCSTILPRCARSSDRGTARLSAVCPVCPVYSPRPTTAGAAELGSTGCTASGCSSRSGFAGSWDRHSGTVRPVWPAGWDAHRRFAGWWCAVGQCSGQPCSSGNGDTSGMWCCCCIALRCHSAGNSDTLSSHRSSTVPCLWNHAGRWGNSWYSHSQQQPTCCAFGSNPGPPSAHATTGREAK
mmetsp:Transcript_25492/g.73193  ORF Transcript_25492/g.73193 Transcript_25492/m.73193 type:complete len:266 (+) Transcript_25492:291-1088(+)